MYEGGKLAELNLNEILPNRFQPRILFDETKLNELAKSIRKHGVIQPIVVRPINNKYEIIAGERRYKASLIAGKMKIPAIVVAMNDKDAEEIALLENVQRQPLSPIEEGVSFKRILDNGYISASELSEKIGKSQTYIANKVNLLNLDDSVQEALLNGKISERHARSLLKIKNNDDQVAMLNRIINERLTVKMADREIRNYHNKKEGENSMDIDKIMNEAKDINQEPKVNDISDLMKGAEPVQNNQFTANPMANQEQSMQQTPVNNNKFINIMPNPEIQESNTPQTPVTNTEPSNIFEQIPNNTVMQNNPNIQMPVATEVPQNNPNNINNQFINTTATTGQNNLPPIQTTETITPQEQVSPAYHEIGTNNNIQPNDVETLDAFTNTNTINNVQNSAQPNVQPNEQNQTKNNNFSTIINLIRECSNKIEDLGYFVNVDEMDLGDNYQVTFKISK